ncbi:hypothetical protein PUNSTDRAFT_54247 [Punctularia strigosozonata HHB-11173 SS5]|uniref:uncharacterized protein n=1 Tax=Punctularia strigosozonata (strain HHB-11173) TaxID=741275 RepID=UPI000441675D|nr:uncharacterized protein PUNSTDRAFT_54247 [Punctularia strigosozonata HHB-11173 SS5]EIN06911.1 hypothetical protein PUNSTDRAFT_54247 [Punctularia strigosozonata HHB-11173 SS5]
MHTISSGDNVYNFPGTTYSSLIVRDVAPPIRKMPTTSLSPPSDRPLTIIASALDDVSVIFGVLANRHPDPSRQIRHSCTALELSALVSGGASDPDGALKIRCGITALADWKKPQAVDVRRSSYLRDARFANTAGFVNPWDGGLAGCAIPENGVWLKESRG